MSTPERAGWYDDPEDDSQLRYFDGIIWSDRTVPRRAPSRQPAATADLTGQQPVPATDVFGRPVADGQPGQHATPEQQPGQHSPWSHGQQPQGGPQQPAWAPAHQHAGWGQQPSEPTTEDGQPLAGYGARVGAYLLDALLVGLLNLVLTGWAWYLWMADYWSFVWDAAVAGDQDAVNDLTPEQLWAFFDWQFFFLAMALSLLLQVAYHVGFLSTRGATPGKMAVGLSVRQTGQPGPLTVGTAFMRYLLPLGVAVFSMVPLISYVVWIVSATDLLWPIKDERRQALHDKIAGTQVVRGKQLRQPKADETSA